MFDVPTILGIAGTAAISIGTAISLTGNQADDEQEETFIENESGRIMGVRSCRVEDESTTIPQKWNERRSR